MTPEQAYCLVLLALCVWREARGEPPDAKSGVAWAIRNRVLSPTWWGTDWITVILKPYQFSSFNHDDPNATKFPSPLDNTWTLSLELASEVYAGSGTDPTLGATHYFDKTLDPNPPNWARDGSMVHTVDLGNLHFWKRA